MTLQDLLLRVHDNLRLLKERKAKQGDAFEVRLSNEINDHHKAIALIEQAIKTEMTATLLETLKADLRELLDAVNVDQIKLDELAVESPLLPFEPETVLIPAGPFVMGGDDGEPYEGPQHNVILKTYRIGKYPVMNRQYAEFIKQMKEIDPPKRADWEQRAPPPDKLDHPVVGVSWYEAQAYCQWLSEQTEQTGIYRLPAEAEWEKAARGSEGQIYPWGNDWAGDCCNIDPEKGTTPVISKSSEDTPYYPDGVSPYGCCDMLGNIQEWTNSPWGSDLFDNEFGYPFDPEDNREEKAAARFHIFRIHRGRSFRDQLSKVRCSNRGYASPDSKVNWRGFRVVLDIDEEVK